MSARASLTRLAGATLATKLIAAGAGSVAAFLTVTVVLLAWVATVAGAGASAPCAPSPLGGDIPAQLRPIFAAASTSYRLGARGPSVLAALTNIESGFGQNMGPSSAGAIGWTQFLPSTWQAYGVDADGDGVRDPYDPDDAIHASANYLSASGAPADWRRALFAYNHSTRYVSEVLALAERYAATSRTAEPVDCAGGPLGPDDGVRATGPGHLAPIPGFPGELVDRRILDDVVFLIRTYRLTITDAYALTGHERHGEHPLGLALDIVPGPDGTWDDVDRLARWAEPTPGRPRQPFRWVGYDGDANHGRGDHLHLSWSHAPAAPGGAPPAWVMTLGLERTATPRRR